MRVIVNKQKPIALILDLKPASRVLEFTQGGRNFLKWNSKLGGECDYAKRIVHVMFSGNIKRRLAEFLAVPINAKNRAKVLQLDIDPMVMGILRKSVRDSSVSFRTQSNGVGIVNVVEHCSARLIDEFPKDFFNRSQIGIKIEVLFLDIQNEGVLGMKAAQGAIAFVPFGNKIFAAPIPMRVRSEKRNFGADIMRRMESAFAQHVCGHCRGSGFAVHSGDNNPALCAHDCSQGFRATHDRFTGIAPAYQNWIVRSDCGRKNDKLGGIRVLRTMLLMKPQA